MTIRNWKEKAFDFTYDEDTVSINLKLSANNIQGLLNSLSASDSADIICEALASDKELFESVKKWVNETGMGIKTRFQ